MFGRMQQWSHMSLCFTLWVFFKLLIQSFIIDLVQLSISSWISFSDLWLFGNLSILSMLSNWLACNVSQYIVFFFKVSGIFTSLISDSYDVNPLFYFHGQIAKKKFVTFILKELSFNFELNFIIEFLFSINVNCNLYYFFIMHILSLIRSSFFNVLRWRAKLIIWDLFL